VYRDCIYTAEYSLLRAVQSLFAAGGRKSIAEAWFILTIILHFLAEFLIIVGYGLETIDIEM
jgi:hypothetical protein